MPSHLHRYDEPGHIHFLTVSCYRRLPFFGTSEARNIVVEAMRASRHRLGFRWIAYVVMPEHVHWLISPQQTSRHDPIHISTILQSLKTSIGRWVKAHLRRVWASARSLADPRLNNWARAATPASKPIWTTRGIDVKIFTEARLIDKLNYCHANPVVRGLADRPEEWVWSSYRFYEQMDYAMLPMDWKGDWDLL
jgi:putative transposase